MGMSREEAIERLIMLEGQDCYQLAKEFKVTVEQNKGWFGHVVERYLGIPLNSSRAPNFGSWELKTVPLKYCKDKKTLVLKETMAITMFDPVEVTSKTFEESHLYTKLQKILVVARIHIKATEQTIFYKAAEFNLDEFSLYQQIKDDYELIREILTTQGFMSLTGSQGQLIQTRTKGAGHGSISRAFYARKSLLGKVLDIPATCKESLLIGKL